MLENTPHVLSYSEQEDEETGCSSLSLDLLADDLKQLVTEDNESFQNEIRQWDENKDRKVTRAANAATSTKEDEVVFLGERSSLSSGD